MKSNTHPENYRLVAFKDMSNNDVFITKSTVETKETTKIDGVEYPLFKLEISRTSHPYYTGKSKLVDTAGRVDKFRSKYANFNQPVSGDSTASEEATAEAPVEEAPAEVFNRCLSSSLFNRCLSSSLFNRCLSSSLFRSS